MLGNGISLIWCHFYSCLLSNWLFAEKFSNCSNSLNFEAKINCNTIKLNVPKWRKTCTGLKFDLFNFYGPQSNIHTFEIPVFFGPPCRYLHWYIYRYLQTAARHVASVSEWVMLIIYEEVELNHEPNWIISTTGDKFAHCPLTSAAPTPRHPS